MLKWEIWVFSNSAHLNMQSVRNKLKFEELQYMHGLNYNNDGLPVDRKEIVLISEKKRKKRLVGERNEQ